ncbi:hypothetical protein ACFQDN_25395 [Pseudomonas asuensis]|nr:hypothetical protein [Pseudomonas asuensis]
MQTFSTHRIERATPLANYGALIDGRSVARVAADGSIDGDA